MHHYHDANDTVLPLLWTPTRGNNIPPHAVPLGEGPDGPLYVARGLIWGETHIGTTSHAFREGARLHDRDGEIHAVFDYEVLTCASSLRFLLDAPRPPAQSAETVLWAVRRDSVSTIRTSHPTPSRNIAPPPVHIFGHPASPSDTGRKRPQYNSPPHRSPSHGTTEVHKHPRPMALSGRESVQFKYLVQSKCFVLIDDTPSMQTSWSQTREALAGVVKILSSDDKWNGFNIRFIHHAQARPCVKTQDEFESLFDSVTTWRGEKVMTARVAQVFEDSLPLILETSAPRPVVFLIITDGIATDAQELFDVMTHLSQIIKGKHIPPYMFRIHLLQMGSDRKAIQPLHDFRDRTNQRDGERQTLKVVSFHRGRGLLDSRLILKFILASVHIPDDEDPDVGEKQSAEAIVAQYSTLASVREMGIRKS